MRRNIDKLSGELQLTNLKTCQTKPEVEVPKIQDPNRQFPAFSRCVSLKYSAERGRYGVAARDIRLGELLCEETPALSSLHPDLLHLQMRKREWLLALRAVTARPLSDFLESEDQILASQRPDYGLEEK